MAGVAAGVNAMMLPITTCTICGLSALSFEARCKTFDASADGYGRGEAFSGGRHTHLHLDNFMHAKNNRALARAFRITDPWVVSKMISCILKRTHHITFTIMQCCSLLRTQMFI